jgi:Probable transposase.
MRLAKIPDEGPLKSYMKNRECWKDLNAQSSQKVIEELSDAFQSWFDLRHKDPKANPPGYRNTATPDHEARSRSKPTVSNTTLKTTVSDSAKGQT